MATETTDPTETLLSLLEPVARRVAAGKPEDQTDETQAAALASALEAEFPFSGATIRAIADEVRRGVAEGWLCTRGEPSARFSRVAKAGPATAQLSVDVVSLKGPAVRHTHPRGEVTLAFAGPDTAPGQDAGRFDGFAPGWVVMAAGSTHTPTVTGPQMHLLYFLPDGAVQWHAAS